ncbi:MAG: GIY-YIG nuclease family protein [Candidatus Pacearchaeota archaeon]
MSDRIIYYLYKTTNLINNKIYIGVHQTKNLNDGYLGSGLNLQRAIKKYSKHNFKKEILKYFDNEIDMFTEEIKVVNSDFIKRKDTYNIVEGGRGGSKQLVKLAQQALQEKYGSDWRKEHIKNATQALQEKYGNDFMKILNKKSVKSLQEKYGDDWHKIIGLKGQETLKQKYGDDWHNIISKRGRQKALSPESRAKRINSFKNVNHQQGSKNSQYGTMWIYHTDTNHNMKIKKDEPIPKGYIKGRKCQRTK